MNDLQKIMDINTNRSNLNLYKFMKDKDKELFTILESARNKWWKMKFNKHIEETLDKKE